MTADVPLISKPAAWLPLLMSGLALSLVLAHVLLFGVAHEADEGAAAHVFQLLVVLQMPLVATFAFTYIPKQAAGAVVVLMLQLAALAFALALVAYLGL